MLMSVFTATEEEPSRVDVSPKFSQRISQSPRMFHRYLFISCVSSSTVPAALSDLILNCPS